MNKDTIVNGLIVAVCTALVINILALLCVWYYLYQLDSEVYKATTYIHDATSSVVTTSQEIHSVSSQVQGVSKQLQTLLHVFR